MMAWLLHSFALTLLLARHNDIVNAAAVDVTGKGPVGVHPIDDRYIAVVDSSIDAVLIVDGNSGGSVVGHLVLHEPENNPVDADQYIGGRVPTVGWVDPLSISSCDECKHLFVTSPNMFYSITLDRPLAKMAQVHDFEAFTRKSTIQEFWPDNWSRKFQGDGFLRMVSVAKDGSSGYVSHAKGGVFSFDPMSPDVSSTTAAHVVHIGDAGIDDQDINGLHHTHSLRNLILTSSKYVHIVKLSDDNGNNPLDQSLVTAYRLPLDYHCDYLYGGQEMKFVDTVIINEYAFVMGHPIQKGIHNGMAIYRLTWDEDDEQWHNCIQVAGSGLQEAAWVDGDGHQSRFSMTPHDIALLPSQTNHMIVIADTDNRALRYVDVTLSIETGDDEEPVFISSVAYNEDLFLVLYKNEAPWNTLTPENVMKSDGKSYFHSGVDSVYLMNYQQAQDECNRVGVGRICTLPEIRARFARGQYPSIDGDDNTWTRVWTNENCSSCHLEQPGACAMDAADNWGMEYKMVANFSPKRGLQMQCTKATEEADTMSMCCGLGGPAVLEPEDLPTTSSAESAATASDSPAAEEPLPAAKKGAVSAAAVIPILVIALVFGLFMRKRAKPAWWPSFLRKDQREETGHAPHREVDLRGRDYI